MSLFERFFPIAKCFREKTLSLPIDHFFCHHCREDNTYHEIIQQEHIGGIIVEYKTPFIAKKLGVSPKAVIRIAQQLNLHLEKNKFGHYIFRENDLKKMLAFQRTTIEQEENHHPIQNIQADSSEELEQITNQLKAVTLRLDRIEEKMQEKADNVVNYQLLQHRREMEDMLEKIEKLESSLDRKEPLYITPDSKVHQQTKKPKRRKMLLSLFGF